MRPPRALSLRAALVWAGAWLAAAAPLAQGRAATLDEEVAGILGGLARPADIARGSAELVRLGARAIGPLFERLCASEGSPEAAIGLPATATLHMALLQLPREDLLRFLEALPRSPDAERRRLAGLDLLGSFGGRAEFTLALDLSGSGDPLTPASPSLRRALERALMGLCTRDSGAPRALAEFFPQADPGSQASIVTVLRRVGGSEAMPWLGALLGRSSSSADGLLLYELGEIAAESGGCEDLQILERVRGYLGHPASDLGLLACRAIGRLRDYQAVPDLIVLLDDNDRNLRFQAHSVLVSLSGCALPLDPQPWISWLDSALSWWDERAEPCRVALVSGSATEAAAALSEVASQRLFVHEAAEMLALAAHRSEPSLLKNACRALGALPERGARRTLLTLVGHDDPEVAAEARHALRRHERMHAAPVHSRPRFSCLRSPAP